MCGEQCLDNKGGIYFPVHLHCILSLAKLSVGVGHVCNEFLPFSSPADFFCSMSQSSLFYTEACVAWNGSIGHFFLSPLYCIPSCLCSVYEGEVEVRVVQHFLYHQDSMFIPKQAKAVVDLRHALSSLEFVCCQQCGKQVDQS